MSRRKSVLGIAVLFALALSAFASANASAVGTTAYTCVAAPNGFFNGPHCLTTAGEGKYNHIAIGNTKTTLAGTNENTASNEAGETTKATRASILNGTLSGVKTELKCTGLSGTGFMENKETAGGEMFAHATGTLSYTGCTVVAPEPEKCKVKGGTVTTTELTGSTEGLTEQANIKPATGTTFATITIEGCGTAGLNNAFPVTGSLKGKITGATITSTGSEVTAQNTLKFGGQKAGLDGALTLKGHKEGEATNPLSVT